jgi:large subunit ribosomal protein L7/L12
MFMIRKEAAMSEQIVQQLSQMSIVELIALTRELELNWGVKAEPFVQAQTQAPQTQAPIVEEKTEFDVELAEIGPNKINVIKTLREITGLGLKEAKEMAESAPKLVRQGVPKAEAEDVKTKLEATGAKVVLK